MDYYEILGVSKDATQEEIKKAFREKAKTTHPDTNREDKTLEEKFKKISEAYDTLSDPQKRQQYDNPRSGFNPFGNFDQNPFDLFGQMFNFRMDQSQERFYKQDTAVKLRISIEDAFHGFAHEKEVFSFDRKVFCEKCDGTGEDKNIKPQSCNHCHGTGMIDQRQNTQMGNFTIRTQCPYCNGTGKSKISECKECSGVGYKKKSETIKLKIPAGIKTGDKISLKGKGNEYQKGKFADLIIIIEIQEHEFYKIQGNDIIVQMPIPVHAVLCESEIEVPTLHGIEKIKIKCSDVKKEAIEIKGKGFRKKSENSFGNQYVVLKFEFPENYSEEVKETLGKISLKEYPEYNQIKEKFKV